MDDLQQQRLARNEAKFREINEHVTDAIEGFRGTPSGSDVLRIMCECAQQACIDMVDVPGGEYVRVRSNPVWFLVAPGHMVEELERAVEREDRYWILEKVGAGRLVAKATDPRA